MTEPHAPEPDRPRRLLLVDDHPLVAEGVRILVETLAVPVDMLWADTLEAAFETIDRDPDIDLTLLDLRLPGHHGFSALDLHRQRYPELPVAVLSGRTERSLILGALERGAMGFIPKTARRDETAGALERVIAGEIFVPIEAMQAAGSGEIDFADGTGDHRLDEAATRASQAIEQMTPRQRDVLRLLLLGNTNKTIAQHLALSDNTVKIHVSAVLHAIGADNRAQAVFIVSRAGARL